MPRVGIRTKLLLVYLLLAIPMVGLLGVVHYRWYDVRREIALRERISIARLTGASFNSFLGELGRRLEADGQVIVGNQYSVARMNHLLRTLFDTYPVSHALVLDSDGRVVATSHPALREQDMSGHEAVRAVVDRLGNQAVEPVERVGADVGFHVARGIDRAGRLQIIMVAFVDVDRLRTSFAAGLPAGGQTIIDPGGRVVYDSQASGLAPALSSWRGMELVEIALGGRETAGDDFVFPATLERRVAAFVPIPGLGWVAGSSAPAAEVLDPVRSSMTQTTLIGAAVLILAAALSAWQAGRIAHSLGRLTAGARRVGQGDFSQPVVISSGDEVEDVARSLDETRRNLKAYTEALTSIAEAGRALTASLDMETLKSTIGHSLEQLFGARISWVLLFNERTGRLEPLLLHGEGLESLWEESLAPGQGVAGRVFQSGEAAVVSDVELERELFGRGPLLGRGARSVVQLPLKIADRPFGVLGMSSPTAGAEAFAGRDLELLGIFANQVSTALQNARFFAERERVADLGRALNRANARLISTLDLPRVLPEVLEQVTEAVGCERAVLALRGDDGWRVEYAVGIPGRYPRVSISLEELPVTALAAQARATVLSNDAENDPRLPPADIRRLGLRSFLAVPLMAHGNVTGVISFAYVSAPAFFSEAEVELARRLAASMSLAMENARLYAAEQDIADTLQEALLRVPPEIPGVEFGQLYRSATELARVGGDFYDLFEIEHDTVAVIIGDVSGHGLEAAALTSLAKNTLKAYSYARHSPAVILQMTNQVLVNSSPLASFVTVFIGLLDKRSGILRYASAGHPPALLARRQEGVQPLGRPSTVLGVFADQTYREAQVVLQACDMLVLYTDGVIEARDEGALFGEARLQELVSGLVGVPAREVPQRILAEVVRFSRGVLSDDVALLAVSLLPSVTQDRPQLRPVADEPPEELAAPRLRLASAEGEDEPERTF